MTYTAWTSDFSVGRSELDSQHIALLNLCKRAAMCLEKDGDAATGDIREILAQLVFYTESHFRDEESLLRECNYPQFAGHQAEHLEYSNRLKAFLQDADRGSVDKRALFEYLADWWGNHILMADKAYMPFLARGQQ